MDDAVPAKKYQVSVSGGAVSQAHGFRIRVTEVWVALPDGESFCFNNGNGLFFAEEPRVAPEATESILVPRDDVNAMLVYLTEKERILDAHFGSQRVS